MRVALILLSSPGPLPQYPQNKALHTHSPNFDSLWLMRDEFWGSCWWRQVVFPSPGPPFFRLSAPPWAAAAMAAEAAAALQFDLCLYVHLHSRTWRRRRRRHRRPLEWRGMACLVSCYGCYRSRSAHHPLFSIRRLRYSACSTPVQISHTWT